RSRLRRRQLHPGATRLREADRDRLLRRARAVLPLADVVHLLLDELARLRAGRLALALVLVRGLQRLLLGHGRLLSRVKTQQERCPTRSERACRERQSRSRFVTTRRFVAP